VQQPLFVRSDEMAGAPRHRFYDKLNEILGAAGFDGFVEGLPSTPWTWRRAPVLGAEILPATTSDAESIITSTTKANENIAAARNDDRDDDDDDSDGGCTVGADAIEEVVGLSQLPYRRRQRAAGSCR
jgi:hypothetical protein